MQLQDSPCTGYGIFSQGSRNVLCWLKVSAIRDGFRGDLHMFKDICTVDLACPRLHGVFLISPKTRLFSPSATGNALPSSDLEISCLSSPQPFGPIRASWAVARECFLEPDGVVCCVGSGVYAWMTSSLCFYVRGWHLICVIQLVRSCTLAMTQDDVISVPTMSRLGVFDPSALIGSSWNCSGQSLPLLQ